MLFLPRETIEELSFQNILRLELADSPVLALALHDGHFVREELKPHLAIDMMTRLREEDPATGYLARVAPGRVLAMRSRFEFDLNRPREQAVYQSPKDAWDLTVWKTPLGTELLQRSLSLYDSCYDALTKLFDGLAAKFGHFLIIDLHNYNHRRGGPDAPVAPQDNNPDINLATDSFNRERFAPLLERFVAELSAFDFLGRRLDVRENVRFKTSYLCDWLHARYPGQACCLNVEVKKFFMDEWKAEVDKNQLDYVRKALHAAVSGATEELSKIS